MPVQGSTSGNTHLAQAWYVLSWYVLSKHLEWGQSVNQLWLRKWGQKRRAGFEAVFTTLLEKEGDRWGSELVLSEPLQEIASPDLKAMALLSSGAFKLKPKSAGHKTFSHRWRSHKLFPAEVRRGISVMLPSPDTRCGSHCYQCWFPLERQEEMSKSSL